MKDYYLQAGETIQKDIAGVGEESQKAVSGAQDFKDIPGYSEEKQTVVDETQVNEAFEPANDAFSGLREAGDWIIEFFTDLFTQLFGNIM